MASLSLSSLAVSLFTRATTGARAAPAAAVIAGRCAITPCQNRSLASTTTTSTSEPNDADTSATPGGGGGGGGGGASTTATATAAASELEEQISVLRAELEEKESALKDSKDRALRALADVENMRLRTEKTVAEQRRYAAQGLAKDVLDVADNLERALGAVPSGGAASAEDAPRLLKSLYEGVTMTESMLQSALQKNGVKRFDPTGEDFDPQLHMAMFKVPDPAKKTNTVHSCTKVGYTLHDRVVRPAEVGVVQNTE